MPPKGHTGNPRGLPENVYTKVQGFIAATLRAKSESDINSVKAEAAKMARKATYRDIFAKEKIQEMGILRFAIQEGNTLLATCLMEHFRVDANSTRHDLIGRSAMHHAAIYGRSELMDDMVNKYNANVNAIDTSHSMPLHLSIYHDKPEATSELVRLGASIEWTNFLGRPMHAAGYLGSLGALKAIHAVFPNEFAVNHALTGTFTPLVCALYGSSDECQDFLAKVSDVSAIPLFSKVALAIPDEDNAYSLMVRLLVGRGNVNNLEQGLFEEPSLLIAAKKNWVRVAGLIFHRTEQIDGIQPWSIEGVLDHVRTQQYIEQDNLRKINKVQQHRPRILDYLRANNVLLASCICMSLKFDMEDEEWNNYYSLCYICEYWSMESVPFKVEAAFMFAHHSVFLLNEQYDWALTAISACLALEPGNQEYLMSRDKVETKLMDVETEVAEASTSGAP